MKSLRLLSLPLTILRNRQRRDQPPRFLTYIVTFRCNARCVMCDSWQKPSPDDLTLEEIDRVFRQLPRLDLVRLTGGEPFMRADLPEIAGLVERHLAPLCLHVTSNGFLTDRIVEFCKRRDRRTPLRLLISIDGMAATHNAVRGRTTAWDRAMETLETLAPQRRRLNLVLTVNQTIVDAAGLEEYRQLRDHLAPLGIRNNVVIAYEKSATYDLRDDQENGPRSAGSFPTFGRLPGRELREFLDEVDRDLARAAWADRRAKRYYLEGIRNRLLHRTGRPNPPCVALGTHLRLLPNGDVPTCQFNSIRVGNLRRHSFAEVWHGQAAGRQRDWVRACPGCWAECEVLPSALYTGDILRGIRVFPGNRPQPNPGKAVVRGA